MISPLSETGDLRLEGVVTKLTIWFEHKAGNGTVVSPRNPEASRDIRVISAVADAPVAVLGSLDT